MQFANCFEIGVGRVYEVLHGAYTHFFPVRRLSTSQLCIEKMSLVIPYDIQGRLNDRAKNAII